MIDYDALVAAGLEDGASIEEIAKGISQALNQAKTKQEEKEKPTPREEVLTHFEDTFKKHYEAGHLNLSDIAAMLVLSVAQDTEEGLTMDKEELGKFFDFAETYIGSALTNYKIFKNLQSKKEELRTSVTTIGDAIQEFLRASTGRECQCGKHECKSQPKSERLRKLTDDEKIEKFLRDLFK